MRKRFDFPVGRNSHYDLNMDPKRIKNSIHSVPFYFALIFLGLFIGLFSVVYFIDSSLPKALTVADEEKYPEAFITERAVNDLRKLTSFGPRVTGGYENEVLTVDYLKRTIDNIIDTAHKHQKIEQDHQIVSGSYDLNILSTDKINTYVGVQNVVVKLYGNSNGTNSSLLVNSHFDSVPTSPGGSDDGINVAAMLEILRKLSQSPVKLEHDVIFLFNGAEETPLQAAHGFITQHEWAKGCKVVVNLEACGHGGKMILFQTGPDTAWLMKYYNKIPHPYGQVAGEEIFQSGVIPSGTDFQVFVDFGNLVGLDFAFFKNGYRYHTKFDDFDHIPLGSYQHVGDNTLALIKHLANAPELSEPVPAPGKMVYFDVFGWFLVSYSSDIGTIVNIWTVVLSFAVSAYSFYSLKMGLTTTVKFSIYGLVTILIGWLMSGMFVALLAFILDHFGKSMSWYANPWMIFGLYIVPTIGFTGVVFKFLNHENLSLNVRTQLQAHFSRLIWTILLLFGTCYKLRSMYLFTIPVLFNSLGFVLIYLCRWQHTKRIWQLVYLLSYLIPTAFLMYQILSVMALFIPIMGRIGSDKNSDLIIGIITVVYTIFLISPYSLFTNSLRNSRYYFLILGAVFAIFVIIVFTPLGFPYSGNVDYPRPQRQWLMHTKRDFYGQDGELNRTDSGVFFLNMDRNSPEILRPYLKELSRARRVEEDCERYLLCGLPLAHAKMIEVVKYSTWIPASQPVFTQSVNFTVQEKITLAPSVVRYNVTASGSDRISIYISPKPGNKLTNISLSDKITQSKLKYNNRPLYFILYTTGVSQTDLTFTFDIETAEEFPSDSTVDVAVTARFVHEKSMLKTPFYVEFLKQFPDWTDVTAWVGTYSLYSL